MKHLLSIFILGAFGFLFYASSSPQYLHYVEKTYSQEEARKDFIDTTIAYLNPVISLEPGTEQTQKKGGVTITCELVPIAVNKSETVTEKFMYRNPDKPNLDVKQVAHHPKYILTPENIQLKLTINNNQSRVLKLRDCAIVMIVDNLQYSLPQENMTQWENSNIISGFSSTLYLTGPQLSTLTKPKSIEVFINDVPTSFDAAGNVLKRENFDWLLVAKTETKTVSDRITYTYAETPVRVEECTVCHAVGFISHDQKCTKCGGDGSYVGTYDQKTYKCDRCSGTGTETVKDKCKTCDGKGAISYPKSIMLPVASQVDWTGIKVEVRSTPPGATVSVYDRNAGKYVDKGITPVTVEWLHTASEYYGIYVRYGSDQVKLIPSSGTKLLSKVLIDFSGAKPVVKTGTPVK